MVTIGTAPDYGYDVERYRGQGLSPFAVCPDFTTTAEDELALWLTTRFGLHGRFAGCAVYLPLTLRPWLLRTATLTCLEDALLEAAGVPVQGPPQSVLFSPGAGTVWQALSSAGALTAAGFLCRPATPLGATSAPGDCRRRA
jgi:hypothetical protein